jgi:hypothetical protein
MTNTSRRALLAGAPAAAVALAGGTALAAVTPDPIFALIADHQAAAHAYSESVHVEGALRSRDPHYEVAKSAVQVAWERNRDLLWEILHAQPATFAGVAALLAHMASPEFPWEEDVDETLLSTVNEMGGEWKRAGQGFPARLAVTMRDLIERGVA